MPDALSHTGDLAIVDGAQAGHRIERLCQTCGEPFFEAGTGSSNPCWRYCSPTCIIASLRMSNFSLRIPIGKRLERMSIPEPNSGCHLFTGMLTPMGYGQIGIYGRKVMAHRLAYEFLVGPVPDGLVLDHLCRNRACLNPSHLEPVTQRVNILRGCTRTAINAAKEVCQRGHRDWIVRKRGDRECRPCRRAQRKASDARYQANVRLRRAMQGKSDA